MANTLQIILKCIFLFYLYSNFTGVCSLGTNLGNGLITWTNVDHFYEDI